MSKQIMKKKLVVIGNGMAPGRALEKLFELYTKMTAEASKTPAKKTTRGMKA